VQESKFPIAQKGAPFYSDLNTLNADHLFKTHIMLTAKHKTGLVFFPAFDWAISPTHPEREERLLYTQDQVFEEGLLDIDGIVEFKPDLVTMKDVQRVHFCVPDPWAVMTESHFISAGGAKTIGMQVMDGAVERGFALVSPLGTFYFPVRGRETVIYQPERRLSYQLPFWISRLGAGSCGNTRAELAPTRYRDGTRSKRVLPSQGCLPKPQAVA
jgi:hypothetical protein